jgi:predicted Zn finger-like uncharacterized protein
VTAFTYTRCPGCATVFRVTEEQLALREGQVRCGKCRAVFDANNHVIGREATPTGPVVPADAAADVPSARALAAATSDTEREMAAADARPPLGAAAIVPANVNETMAFGGAAEVLAEALHEARASPTEDATLDGPALREAQECALPTEDLALDRAFREADTGTAVTDGGPQAAAAAAAESEYSPVHPAGEATDVTDAAAVASDLAAAPIAEAGPEGATASPDEARPATRAAEPGAAASPERPIRYEWKPRRRLSEQPKALFGAAAVILVLMLAVQAVYGYRDLLAAHLPSIRPLLQAACGVLGCIIEPLRDTVALSIEASDLQADPAHRGLLVLSATVRNRAPYAIAYPYLELTLTDASDRVVARRSFAPAEYAGGTANVGAGIPADGEKIVKLFLDASATSQAGYRLYLFYP